VIPTVVAGAGSARQATEIARSGARSYEIDRRLFPWSSDRMRLEEFHRGILPVLAKACVDSIPVRDLELAVLGGVLIETGRENQIFRPGRWLDDGQRCSSSKPRAVSRGIVLLLRDGRILGRA
jgi:hypothetical protein